MIRFSFLMIALFAIPAYAGSDVWRWRDAKGQLHYSNIEEKVPASAEVVRTQIGQVTGPALVPEPSAPHEDVTPPETPRRES